MATRAVHTDVGAVLTVTTCADHPQHAAAYLGFGGGPVRGQSAVRRRPAGLDQSVEPAQNRPGARSSNGGGSSPAIASTSSCSWKGAPILRTTTTSSGACSAAATSHRWRSRSLVFDEGVELPSGAGQGATAAAEPLPCVAPVGETILQRAQCPSLRTEFRVVEFVPADGGRDGGVGAGAHGVGGDRGLGVGVALGVEVEPAAAFVLAGRCGQLVGVASGQQLCPAAHSR